MVTDPVVSTIQPEEYLERERKADFKSELVGGEIVAMAGARRAHRRITTNVLTYLNQALDNSDCSADNNDTRIHIPATGLFTYADALVTCGEEQYYADTRDTLLNPTLIVEVLSPSTEAYDRGLKFATYQSIPSLRSYVLISSDRLRVERFERANQDWLYTAADNVEMTIPLPIIGVELPLKAIYRRVVLFPRVSSRN